MSADRTIVLNFTPEEAGEVIAGLQLRLNKVSSVPSSTMERIKAMAGLKVRTELEFNEQFAKLQANRLKYGRQV